MDTLPPAAARPRRRATRRRVLAALVLLAVGGAGGWLLAEGEALRRRLNLAAPGEASAAPVHEAGRAGGGDIITTGTTRILSLYFTNFTSGETITLTSGAALDVGTILISNGNFATTEYAVGGLYLENASGIPLAFYALGGYGVTTHVLQPPLPLRAGDKVIVVPGSATTNVEWDITLVGTVPGSSPAPAGLIAR